MSVREGKKGGTMLTGNLVAHWSMHVLSVQLHLNMDTGAEKSALLTRDYARYFAMHNLIASAMTTKRYPVSLLASFLHCMGMLLKGTALDDSTLP